MKIRTIIGILLLLIVTINPSCGNTKPVTGSSDDIQKQLAKAKKKSDKAAKKGNKQAYKHYWSMQSKSAKKSIKKNKKRQKKEGSKNGLIFTLPFPSIPQFPLPKATFAHRGLLLRHCKRQE